MTTSIYYIKHFKAIFDPSLVKHLYGFFLRVSNFSEPPFPLNRDIIHGRSPTKNRKNQFIKTPNEPKRNFLHTIAQIFGNFLTIYIPKSILIEMVVNETHSFSKKKNRKIQRHKSQG